MVQQDEFVEKDAERSKNKKSKNKDTKVKSKSEKNVVTKSKALLVKHLYGHIKNYTAVVTIAVAFLLLKIYGSFSEDSASSIYDFTVRNIYGKEVDLSVYRGRVCIIVNVASLCSHADTNYEVLSYIHDITIEGNPVEILAFPSNQFDQEPGDAAAILRFARERNAPFDLFEKVDVAGENAHPLFKYLERDFGEVKWNFYKYVVNERGVPVLRFSSDADYYKLSSALKDMFEVDE